MTYLNVQILVSYKESLGNSGPTQSDFLIREGYLFKGVSLYISHTLLRNFLVWEFHVGGLAGQFGRDKTIALDDRLY